MTCKHLELNVCRNAAADTNDRHVPPQVCRVCLHYDGPSRGLGDTVYKALDAVGAHRVIKACGGCAERRKALNEKFPNSANESIDGEPK